MKSCCALAVCYFWWMLCLANVAPSRSVSSSGGAAAETAFYHRRLEMARFEYKLRSKSAENWDDDKEELDNPIADAIKEKLQETYGELVRIECQGNSFDKKGGKAMMEIVAYPKTMRESQKLAKELRSELYLQIKTIFQEVQKAQKESMICTLTTPPENARDRGDYSYRIYFTGEPPSTLQEISSLYHSGDLSTDRVYYCQNKEVAQEILSRAAKKSLPWWYWLSGCGWRTMSTDDRNSLDVYAYHNSRRPDKARRRARAAIEQKASEYGWFEVVFHSDLLAEQQEVAV